MDALQQLLFSHYYDVQWSKKHQGFRCVCGWLGDDHVGHVAKVITDAGFVQVGSEVAFTDRDTYTKPGL